MRLTFAMNSMVKELSEGSRVQFGNARIGLQPFLGQLDEHSRSQPEGLNSFAN
jgi:hypothetical protein